MRPAALSSSFTSACLKNRNERTTAATTATMPQKRATKVPFMFFVQALKSDEKSMSGMAKGTHTVCRIFCHEPKVSATSGAAGCVSPESDMRMPKA